MTRKQLILTGQQAAFDALPGLLQWDEAGVIARDVLEVVVAAWSPLVSVEDDDL